MNKEQVKGRVKEATGTIKEVVGTVVGNDRLKVKGQVEQTVGEAQAGLGDLKNTIDNAS
ncbi:MAG: CsbD family protein [Gammaproteobacteria bacterium]|nr:CsbD family protein [Gammaproteobacteria bacterium]